MTSTARLNKPNDSLPESDAPALVVLNIFAHSAQQLHSYLSQDAKVSTPDPAYEYALELFENTRLGGSVLWINAEGVTLDELALLEKQWLPIAGKALMLMGSNEMPVINRSLQGLMAARRDNPRFEALVLTHPDSAAATTTRLIATQSGGWLRHEAEDTQQPTAVIANLLSLLALPGQVAAPANKQQVARQPSAQIIELPITPQATAAPTSAPPSSAPPSREDMPSTTANKPNPTPTEVSQPPTLKGNSTMATLNDSMNACMQIDGALAAGLIDSGSGMALAKIGSGINLDVAAAGNTEVVKAKIKTMAALGIKDTIEDILITLGTQYHLIRPVPHKQGLFLYLVLDKTKGNLAMARFKLMEIEKGITV